MTNISEKIKNFFKNDPTIQIAYTGVNKLSKFIKVLKDKLPIMSHMNVVYKIDCKDCDASYVGQTNRMLKTRIKEHRNHINWKTSQHSVITAHRLEYAHDFDWRI